MKVYLAVLFATLNISSFANEIIPLWEHTLLDRGTVLPILVYGDPDPRWDGDPEDAPWYGVNLHDQYDGFVRFDENRLMLGIRDNGIDESDPDHDALLAAQYPDRSIIWIDPDDGSPMGIALNIGFKPVELSDEYESMIDGGSGTPPITDYLDPKDRRFVSGSQSAPEYMNFDVSDDGVLYLGYWYMVLRYDPDGQGGFTGPQIVYEQDYRNHGGTERISQWRFGDIEVWGSGANTKVVLTGKTWRNGMRTRVFDVDANTNQWTIRGDYADTKNGSFGLPGGYSHIIPDHQGRDAIYGASHIRTRGIWKYNWVDSDFVYDELMQVIPAENADGYNISLIAVPLK